MLKLSTITMCVRFASAWLNLSTHLTGIIIMRGECVYVPKVSAIATYRHTHTFTFMKFISKPNEIKHVLKVSQNWLNNFTVEYGIKCTCQMLVLRLFVLTTVDVRKFAYQRETRTRDRVPQSIISFYFQIFIIIYIVSHIYDGFAYEIFLETNGLQ